MNTCSVIFKMSEIDSNHFIIYRTYQNQRQGALLNKYNWTHSTTCSIYQSYQHLLQMISALPLVESGENQEIIKEKDKVLKK